MRLILFTSALFLFSLNSFAEDLRQSPSDEIFNQIYEYNLTLSTNQHLSDFSQANRKSNITAFSEWSDETGYLVFSDEDRYDSKRIKQEMVSHLPESVKVIVYTQSTRESHYRRLIEQYSKFISKDRIIVLKLPRGGRTNFWTRDNTPIAVKDQNQNPYLVDAKYYYAFEPDEDFSRLFEIDLISNPYFFEGGNLVNNSKGDCIVVNRRRRYPYGVSDTAAIPDQVFLQSYGCTNLIRLEHLKGIGHSDEVTKFINDNTVLTDTKEYKEILESHGFTVHMLPEPDRNYETYANSLIVNNTVYVPVFNQRSDEEALRVYEDLMPGYTIIPVESSELATGGQGGIHCITMNYPAYPLKDLADVFGGEIVD